MIYGLISTDHAEPQFFPASEFCPSAARVVLVKRHQQCRFGGKLVKQGGKPQLNKGHGGVYNSFAGLALFGCLVIFERLPKTRIPVECVSSNLFHNTFTYFYQPASSH